MARNKNVGRTALADAGLVLQAKPEIDRTEFGMRQSTLRFHLRNEKYPAIDPDRGTPCNEFTAGDSRTTAIMAALNYLGSQTSKFIRSGFAPGIGILDVLCQGAIFNQGESVRSVVAVLIVDRGTNYTIAPNLTFNSADEVTPASAYVRLRRKVNAISAAGTGYVVGDIITFVGGTFDVVHKERVTQVNGTGGIVASTVYQRSEYSIVPSNPVSVTGGTGTGAQLTVTWELGIVHVAAGGNYKGSVDPSVILAFAASETPGHCVATMGAPHFSDDLLFTIPFDPVTTVKDTVQLSIYGASEPTPSAVTLQARVASPTLGRDGYFHSISNGLSTIQGFLNGALPPVDGSLLNVGDRVLLTDNSAYGGLYQVNQVGRDAVFGDFGAPWIMQRVPEMDESAEVTAITFVSVAEGVENSGSWICTAGTPFTLDTDHLTFERRAAVPTLIVTNSKKVTIDYHAIELHFEYMAATRHPRPRFIQVEYQRNANGEIIVNPNVSPQVTQAIEVDEVSAILQITTKNVDGNVVAIVDGPVVTITEAEWRAAVKYIGTSAQFEQIPAGQFYHVTEQTTIKIAPITSVGTVGG